MDLQLLSDGVSGMLCTRPGHPMQMGYLPGALEFVQLVVPLFRVCIGELGVGGGCGVVIASLVLAMGCEGQNCSAFWGLRTKFSLRRSITGEAPHSDAGAGWTLRGQMNARMGREHLKSCNGRKSLVITLL